MTIYLNKKYVLSNSQSVQCKFFIFDHMTFIQFKVCCCLPNFIESRWFFTEMWRYNGFQNGGRTPSWNCFTTIWDHPRSLCCCRSCQISCQSDRQVCSDCYCSYLNFLHIWLAMPIQAPKMGVLKDFGPLNVIIHHRDPQKGTSLRKSASFKLSTVKISWAVWPVGELTESVTDTQTDRHR